MARPWTLLVVGIVVLGAAVGIAGVAGASDGAQSQQVREGGTYSGGTVVVEGPIDGDVRVFAGTVIVRGTIDGDVQVYGGSVQVPGEIRGSLEAFAATVVLDGEVTGDVSVASGTLAIDGRVGGTVRSASATTQLGENAVVADGVRYSGEVERAAGSAVDGGVARETALGVGPVVFPPIGGWFFTAFVALAHLSLGVVLLLGFPAYARSVEERVASDPLVTGAAGLGVLVGVPAVLGVLAVTFVAIPLALVGLFCYLVLLWVGIVYGRFAVGYWLVRRAGRDSAWLGLVLGVVGFALLVELPVVGAFLRLGTLLLGLGALGVGAARELRRRRGEIDAPEASSGQPTS